MQDIRGGDDPTNALDFISGRRVLNEPLYHLMVAYLQRAWWDLDEAEHAREVLTWADPDASDDPAAIPFGPVCWAVGLDEEAVRASFRAKVRQTLLMRRASEASQAHDILATVGSTPTPASTGRTPGRAQYKARSGRSLPIR